jgi:hypothetical protein
MPENEQEIGPRWLNIYKRRGRYHRVLYTHTTIVIGPFRANFSRWHDLDGTRRDYHAEFGYDNGNEDGVLNPNVQWMFHR